MTCKKYILEVFKENPHKEWIAGGIIEDRVRYVSGHKASYVARQCRKMREEGVLEKREDKGYLEYKSKVILGM